MYSTAAALKTFFSGFGLPAYDVESVPPDVTLPYITYSVSDPEWRQKASIYAQIWYRTTSNTQVSRKADQILADIGEGKRIDLAEGGHLLIWPENPACQILKDGDIRYAYINLSINSYHMQGV